MADTTFIHLHVVGPAFMLFDLKLLFLFVLIFLLAYNTTSFRHTLTAFRLTVSLPGTCHDSRLRLLRRTWQICLSRVCAVSDLPR